MQYCNVLVLEYCLFLLRRKSSFNTRQFF